MKNRSAIAKCVRGRLSSALLAILLAGCLTDEARKAGGSVVENEVAVGVLLLADGRPASGAEVTVYPVDHVPGGDGAPQAEAGPYRTTTDALGRFALDSLPRGEYNILGKRGALLSYQDSVFLSGDPVEVAADTLLAGGTLTGWVRLQPNHNPQTVTLQALGTHVFANPGMDGRFTLGPLAEGSYTVRVVTTEDQYTPLYAGLMVRAGSADTLADTLKPVFTGVPAVQGLKVAYDTLAGVATVSWNRARYAQALEYQVLRNPATDVVPPTVPIAVVRDTFYRDTLFLADSLSGPGAVFPPADSAVRRLQYRVKAVNLSDVPGASFGRTELTAPSPWFVRTTFDAQVYNLTHGKPVVGGRVTPGDSLRVNVWYRNPTRGLRKVRWYAGASNEPVRVADLPGSPEGVASLFHVTGPNAGTEILRLRMEDDAGTVWSAAITLAVLEDAPEASAGPDQVVGRGETIHLSGAGTDGIGRIVKWEWDIGGSGEFASSNPDTSFTAPSVFRRLPCVLRITDEDGFVATDTVFVEVGLTWRKAPVSLHDQFGGDIQGHRALSFGGKLWILGCVGPTLPNVKSKYLPRNYASTDGALWVPQDTAKVFPGRTGHGALVHGGRMWVMGGRGFDADPAHNPPAYGRNMQYDVWSSADGVEWEQVSKGNFPGEDGFAVVSFKDRMWTLGGKSGGEGLGVYHSADGILWSRVVSDSPLPPLQGHSAVVHADRIWVMGGSHPLNFAMNRDVWSSEDGVRWFKVATNSAIGDLAGHRSVAYGGKIWILGGYRNPYVPLENEHQTSVKASPTIWSSSDGIAWHPTAFPGADFPAFGFGAVVHEGALWTLFGLQKPGTAFQTYTPTVWKGM